MFSGIIQSLQPIIDLRKKNEHLWVTIKKPKSWKTKIGESININGVCSTILTQTKSSFTFEYMPETLRLITLYQDLPANLERSLKLNDLVGGHLVSGHVDCSGIIKKISSDHQSKILTIKYPKKFSKYIINKGSIAINGVSLTICNPKPETFSIALIQHTLKYTNLSQLKINDQINLEFDLIGKYVHRFNKI